jgi:hypothetical protein
VGATGACTFVARFRQMRVVWACVFACSAVLLAAAAETEELREQKPWHAGGKEDWEAAGGWDHPKYDR